MSPMGLRKALPLHKMFLRVSPLLFNSAPLANLSALRHPSSRCHRLFSDSTPPSRTDYHSSLKTRRVTWKHSEPETPFEPTDVVVLRTFDDVQRWRQEAIRRHHRIGLVPTMGALHQGHKKLMSRISADCDEFCVSIFVNPTQFGPSEDFDTYPRGLQADLRQLREVAAGLAGRSDWGRLTAVFVPSVETMYPNGLASPSIVRIDPRLSQVLEGKARPHFFDGVATVVMKLFNIVRPHTAVFGQKDIQQLVVLKHMVKEFCMPVEIHGIGTARQDGGLAVSSRNKYLGARRRNVAPVLHRAMTAALSHVERGARDRETIVGAALQVVQAEQTWQLELPRSERAPFTLDYMSLACYKTLQELPKVPDDGVAILSGAIVMLPLEELHVDETDPALLRPVRLIDNMTLLDKKMIEVVDEDASAEEEGGDLLDEAQEEESGKDATKGNEPRKSPLE